MAVGWNGPGRVRPLDVPVHAGREVDLEHPPEILQVKEMKPAMETMKCFSEKELEYDLYERRRLAVMDAKALQDYKEEIQAKMAEILAEGARIREEWQAQQAKMQAEIKAQQAKMQAEMQAKMQAQQAKIKTQLEQKDALIERERKEKEQERKEKERLLNLIKQSGIDPDKVS